MNNLEESFTRLLESEISEVDEKLVSPCKPRNLISLGGQGGIIAFRLHAEKLLIGVQIGLDSAVELAIIHDFSSLKSFRIDIIRTVVPERKRGSQSSPI